MTRNIQKIITFVMALIFMLSCMSVVVHAQEDINKYFTDGKITLAGAPVITDFTDESGTEIELHFATPQAMFEIGTEYGPGVDNVFGTDGMCLMGAQFDYKVNNGAWHYTESWDKLDQSNVEGGPVTVHTKMNGLYGPDTSYNAILLSTYNEVEDYRDIAPLLKGSGETKYVDLENGSIHFRMRTYVYYKLQDGTEHYVFSDWSQEQKPGEILSSEEKHEFVAPKIAYIEMNASENETNFNIQVEINEEIINELMQFKSIYGSAEEFLIEGKLIPVDKEGNMMEAEAIELINRFPDRPMSEGFHLHEPLAYELFYEGVLDRYDRWAITVRFVGRDQFESKYSEPELISILATEDPNQDEEGNLIIDDPVVEEKCSLCGFCGRPLGMCVFTIGVIIVIAVVIIAFAAFFIRKKRNDNMFY